MSFEKEVLEADKEFRSQFDDSELDKFFNSRIWKEVLKMVVINQGDAIKTLSSPGSTREEDLVAKGELTVYNFLLNLREVLTADIDSDDSNMEAQDA